MYLFGTDLTHVVALNFFSDVGDCMDVRSNVENGVDCFFIAVSPRDISSLSFLI